MQERCLLQSNPFRRGGRECEQRPQVSDQRTRARNKEIKKQN
jgi:hypothetical protein